MRKLVHEIWEEVETDGTTNTCCFAGQMGEACRRMLGANARLLTTFEAGSHFEAMTFYNRYLGFGEYTTDQEWDYQPYPEEWFQ